MRGVHQVLATLGYGDAIGHEVLGIQRVLRAAGYESDVFVETADRRLEPQTRDYRELIDASRADNLLLHHFSIGSKASRTAYALPDRMALIYHNITPPEYFVGIHRTLARQCFRGRRELLAYVDRCDLALGDSEFNREDLESLGFPRTAVLPVVPDFSQEGRGSDPFLSCLSHALQSPLAAPHRRRVQHVRALSRGPAPHDRRAEAVGCPFCRARVGRRAGRVLRRRRATMDGAGVLYDSKDPLYVASLIDALVSNATLQDAIVSAQLAAVRRLQAKDFSGTLLNFVDRIFGAPRAAAPHVAYDFWHEFDAAQEIEELRIYRPSAYKGLPAAIGK